VLARRLQVLAHSLQVLAHSLQVLAHSLQVLAHSLQVLAHSLQVLAHSLKVLARRLKVLAQKGVVGPQKPFVGCRSLQVCHIGTFVAWKRSLNYSHEHSMKTSRCRRRPPLHRRLPFPRAAARWVVISPCLQKHGCGTARDQNGARETPRHSTFGIRIHTRLAFRILPRLDG
jgi:hypothetical protein